jgi:hypothetical protein
VQLQKSLYPGSTRDFAVNLAGLLWRLLCFPVAALLRLLDPVVSTVSIAIAVTGILVSVVLELSGSAPHFPFWGALAFFIGCGLVPLIYSFLIRALVP